MSDCSITLQPEVRERLAVAAVRASGVRVAPAAAPLVEAMRGVEQTLRGRWQGRLPSEIPDLAPARTLYRAFGIDPTRTRPSSEALLRRILKGGSLPHVNNAVDLANLLAVRLMLPIGLFDVACIEGAIEIREGRPGESYPGIRKGAVTVEGRPVVADRGGAFGNPTSDSLRTSIRDSTDQLLLIVFALPSVDAAQLTGYATAAIDAMTELLNPGVAAQRVEL